MEYIKHRTKKGINSIISEPKSLSSTRKLELLLLSYQTQRKSTEGKRRAWRDRAQVRINLAHKRHKSFKGTLELRMAEDLEGKELSALCAIKRAQISLHQMISN